VPLIPWYTLFMIQVEVAKTGNENSMSLLRKFTRRVQGTGVVQHMRNHRYRSRSLSKFTQKKQALKRIKKREHFEQLLKEGKVSESPRRGRK